MQQSPSIYAMMFISVLLLFITWLGGHILAKWHPIYAGRRGRWAYWLVTISSVLIIVFSRWLRPANGFPGEWFRMFIYGAYVWMIGLLFLLPVLFVLQAVRLLWRKLGKGQAGVGEHSPGLAENEVRVGAVGAMTRRDFLATTAAAVPAVPFAFSGYGVISGDAVIVRQRHTISVLNLPDALDGFKIAQISDTHIGPFFGMDKLDRVLNMVTEERPELLAITGDLVDDLDLLAPTMARLTSFQPLMPRGIYYCWGNHEYFRDIGRIRQALMSSPITVLENSNRQVVDGVSPLYLAGVDYPWARNKAEQQVRQKQFFDQAVRSIPTGAVAVLLAHHPDFLDNAFAAGIPLTLSGHTHGGQVAVFGRSIFPVQYKYMRGMYRHNDSYGYVSLGSGHWLPLRIGCPAEIGIFTLRKA